MDTTLQILVGIFTLMLTGLGVMSMFAPQKMLANFALEPIGKAGLNTVRSVMGGLFLASVAMLVFGLTSGDTEGYFFVAVVMLAVAIGRIVGIVLDGFDKAVVPPLVLELVIAGVLTFAHFKNGGFY
ncbi:DUF4345 domain-containing protein [Vibrio tubiashii]|uniref:DUF4345 domain-containing protein n=1 Tax=Vibrio tubiashii ATCC 19109 TaxID=1051646 RepID=F9T1A0_9VIBR|nr:DUF4345 family protein [Vibrio tubiashii]AIW15834.1 hypothetical protein IX91_17185 [Vibrio tubiashii ATCC 19109]EGU58342.1 hypothetical protein VITU9109_01317 [Vibrio tubiashii ATCC 19109]EIF05166.1 hypothetical protein VT1337_05207 [Vibrio tubiashii NCIMB 1337 = ATCC 19106]